MKSDANKGISLIEYNTYLNKVKQVTWSDGRWLKFNYDGGGSLIKKENSAGEYWNYVGDLIYKNGTFYSINIPEGRAVFENNLWNYEFDYRDIWGNLRVSFSAENGQLTLKQKSDYDAFGYTFNQSSGVNKNFFQYQKQQRIEDFDLNVDFFKFRPSDPTIGRFWMVDPLSSQYPHNSVYALQENKFGKGIELEGAELKEFGQWLGNKVDQVLSYTDVDDITVTVTNFTRGGNAVHIDGSKANTSDKLFAAGGLFLPAVSGGAIKKIGGALVDNVKDVLKIDIPDASKVNRELLNPPSKDGYAPTFKKDGSKVEIHHEGQDPKGPFKEMHKTDHRGKGNDAVNHPDKNKPSQIDRKEFNKARKEYWKEQYPKK